MNPENQNSQAPQQPESNPAPAPQPDTAQAPNAFAQQFNAAPAGPQAVQSPLSQPLPAAPEGGLTQWPGAFGIFKISKDAVLKNIVVLIVFGVVIGGINISLGFAGDEKGFGILLQLVSYALGALASVGTSLAYVYGVRGKDLPLGEAFSKSFALFIKMFVLQIVVTFLSIASLLLLVVPFFFVFPRLLLSQYYLVDKDLGPIEAVKASWNSTKGHVGKVYGILGVSLLMLLPIITIIGIIATIILLFLYSAAYAVLYQYVLNTSGVTAATPNSPAAPAAPSAPSAPNAA
jgi:hypothetical protein